MNKLLLLALLCSTFCACKSNLDKKVVLTEYKKVMEEIKSDEKKYTEEDYKTAADEIGKYLFQNIATPSKPLDITYGKILDHAHALNLKNKEEIEKYNTALLAFNKVFAVTATDSKYISLADQESVYNDYSDRYDVHLRLTNNKPQAIGAFKGMLHVNNEKGEELMSFLVEKTYDIPANGEIETIEQGLIMDDDNLMELKTLPFAKLKFEWRPAFVIYKDGTRVEAPETPAALFKN
ncbi:gluzincin family metallopeptidase [Pedobacter endophyticus]|uniref:Uncharacterized protein n=1 Tax=Pedobacter endophyticus TaxID=2789740 RepID=A0A7S9KYX3_9SPHI|nr:hypothetical protein [Pedobacter endophyticus]QPH39400.1 hypothetical protein IZT61_20550 [Pedobacter endophyticus]